MLTRRCVAVAALLFFAGVNAAAAQTATGTGTAVSGSSSQAAAGGGSVIINSGGSSRIKQSGSLRTVPNAIAPGLGSAAVESCATPGVSGAVAVTGFGLSLGSAGFDPACNRRLNARTLYAFGFKAQALRVMLNEPEVAAAFGAGGQVYSNRQVYSAPAAYRPTSCRIWRGGVIGLQCLD